MFKDAIFRNFTVSLSKGNRTKLLLLLIRLVSVEGVTNTHTVILQIANNVTEREKKNTPNHIDNSNHNFIY